MSLFEDYATLKRWPIRSTNIMVEGESDRIYVELAARLHHAATGRWLVGQDLSVFPPGDGDAGGVYGIQEQLPVACSLAGVDLDANGKRRYRIVGLMDGDSAGKGIARSIVGANRSLLMWQDVYLLQRVMPTRTRDVVGLGKHVDDENRKWRALDTVMEDLIDVTAFDLFAAECPQHCRPRQVLEGEYHYHFAEGGKPPFRRFVEQNGDLGTLARVVAMIAAMRFYLGLDVNGV